MYNVAYVVSVVYVQSALDGVLYMHGVFYIECSVCIVIYFIVLNVYRSLYQYNVVYVYPLHCGFRALYVC